MKQSLKTILFYLIKSQGEISLNEIENLCHDLEHKMSYAERELRHLMESKEGTDPDVEPIYNAKRTAIIGYKPFTKPEQGVLIQ